MEKNPVVGPPGGFFVRFGALVLDMLIFGATLPVFGIVMAILIPLVAHSRGSAVGLVSLGFFLGIPCLYFTLATGIASQTLGKKAFNLKVVRMDGTPISVFQSFLRWFFAVLFTLPLGFGCLFVALREDRRALHDLICGTKVVLVKPYNQVALIVLLCVLPFMGIFVGGILAAIAIPRFAQMLEKSREGATKLNLRALKTAVSTYYMDQGKYPVDLEKDMVGKYIDKIPPVKVTGQRVREAQSPAGTMVTMAEKGQVPTGSGSGWLYDSNLGQIYINSTLQDSKGIPYSFYGFE